MILKSNGIELEILQKETPSIGKTVETRLQAKMLPTRVDLVVGMVGRVKIREMVGATLTLDSAQALYDWLHKRFKDKKEQAILKAARDWAAAEEGEKKASAEKALREALAADSS